MYHQEGRRIAAGGEDGSLHLIDMDRPHVKHEVVREAHMVSGLSRCLGCSAVCFSPWCTCVMFSLVQSGGCITLFLAVLSEELLSTAPGTTAVAMCRGLDPRPLAADVYLSC